jgi:hypothetical protein
MKTTTILSGLLILILALMFAVALGWICFELWRNWKQKRLQKIARVLNYWEMFIHDCAICESTDKTIREMLTQLNELPEFRGAKLSNLFKIYREKFNKDVFKMDEFETESLLTVSQN